MLALGSDAASMPYDVFALVHPTTGLVTIERLVWTNATTRATALVTQDGVYVKSGDVSRRYVGRTTPRRRRGRQRTRSTPGLCGTRRTKYHARSGVERRRTTGRDSVATWRQANGAATSVVAFVMGLDHQPGVGGRDGVVQRKRGASSGRVVALCDGMIEQPPSRLSAAARSDRRAAARYQADTTARHPATGRAAECARSGARWAWYADYLNWPRPDIQRDTCASHASATGSNCSVSAPTS